MTYKIVRKYFRKFFLDNIDDEVIETGLSLEEAQAHCSDPETSSRTCKSRDNIALTEKYGPWFNAYYEEE